MNKMLIITLVFSLPFSICFGQRNIAGQYIESDRNRRLDLFPNGTYTLYVPPICLAPAYSDTGTYEVRGDTVFVSSAQGDSVLDNLLIIRKKRNNENWFWDIGMLVSICYEKEIISKKMVGRLSDYTGLMGDGFKKQKDY